MARALSKVAAGSGAAAAARGDVTGAAAAGASRAGASSSTGASAKRGAVAGGGFLSSLTPRAAGVAVMAMLAFGVVVGSGASSLANSGAPVLVALARKPAAPTTTSSAAATSTPPAQQQSSPPQTQQTVTETAPAQTVTAAAPSTTTSGAGTSTTPAANPSGLPPVKHVFLIVLSGQGYQQMYGADTDLPYLAHELLPKGELLTNYYAVAPSPLANAVALISGQGPTQQTAADCPTFTAIAPATLGHDGQVLGDGCTYPKTTPTLANQLMAKGYTWKAYVEGINDGPTGVAKTCRRPTLGAADAANAPQTGDPYVTWRNPFVYFDSLTARKACSKDDVGLGQLTRDLRSKKTTPSFSYIVPGTCDDGSQLPCVPGATPDAQQADAATDAFLKSVVPAIEHSPAYKHGGLIAITSDEAPQSGPGADRSACCSNPTYPNLQGGTTTAPTTTTTSTTTGSSSTTTAAPLTGPTTTTSATTNAATSTTTPTTTTAATTTTPTTSGPTTTGTTTTSTTTSGTTSTGTTPVGNGETTPTGGGGQVGLLLISSYVKPNTADTIDYYNHFSLLRSIEKLFGLKYLGYAGNIQLSTLDAGTFNAYTP
jgi:phosphatidylinositol-3-phosphatase